MPGIGYRIFLLMSPGFVSPTLCSCLHYLAELMLQWGCDGLEWNTLDLCWIADSMPNITWMRWSNLTSCPVFKVIDWLFSRKMPSHTPPTSHRTCPLSPIDHPWDHIDHQIRSHDPLPQLWHRYAWQSRGPGMTSHSKGLPIWSHPCNRVS